jgi:endonuclease/exonuclease/phosphatase family metal-dependent hydrolase
MRRLWISLTLMAGLTLSALAQMELVVMTYNIRAGKGYHGSDQDPMVGLAQIAEVIRAQDADIVLLQEVDRNVERTGSIDEAAILAEELGMHHAFAPAIPLQGGDYGIAILSRMPMASPESIALPFTDYSQSHPNLPGYYSEPRVAQIVRVASGELELSVINTHLGLTRDQRMDQLEEVADLIHDALVDGRVIFGGDLNVEPDAEELVPVRRLLEDCYHGLEGEDGLRRDIPIRERQTHPADEPTHCIDYLFISRWAIDVLSTEVIETTVSDHRPVVTRLSFWGL